MMEEAVMASAIDATDFKGLMWHVAGAVAVITCGRPGERRGLTATAICSLSDQPPTVLACVNRKSSAHDLIISERAFVVNVLAGDQQEIAERFSGQSGLSGEDRFTDCAWGSLSTGAPVLEGALAAFDCALVEHRPVATHTIFIARVVSGRTEKSAQSLIYLKGNYHTLPVGA